MLASCLILPVTASSSNSLEIGLLKYDDGLGGFAYRILMAASKTGATTFELETPRRRSVPNNIMDASAATRPWGMESRIVQFSGNFAAG